MRVPSNTELKPLHRFPEHVVVRIIEGLRALLQGKHLYQSVTVDVGRIPFAGDDRPEVRLRVQQVQVQMNGLWYPMGRTAVHRVSMHVDPSPFMFTPPDVKLYCTRCHRIEPFNLVSAEDFFGHESRGADDYHRVGIAAVQAFVLSYVC